MGAALQLVRDDNADALGEVSVKPPRQRKIALHEAVAALNGHQSALTALFPEANSVGLKLTATGTLLIEIFVTTMENRDWIVHKLARNMVPGYQFSDIQTGMETGTHGRRRVVAKVTGG